MGNLLDLDQYLFELINTEWANPFFDFILPLFREKLIWAPLYLFVISYALLNLKAQKWYFLFLLLVTVSMTDLTSSELIKKTVKRPRPCHEISNLEPIQVRVHCGSGYSFTSSHAANHFAVAVFLIFTLFKRYRWAKVLLFFWAFTISFAQVYVGVHYPLDILGGALVGTSYALLMAWFFDFFTNRIAESWKSGNI